MKYVKWFALAISALVLLSIVGYNQPSTSLAKINSKKVGIESVMFEGHLSTPPRTSTERILSATYIVPKNITLVGFQLGVAIALMGTPTFTEGGIAGETTIARFEGGWNLPNNAVARASTMGQAFVASEFWTKTIGTTQLGGFTGNLVDIEMVMFPAGQGIDFNAGDTIYMYGALDAFGVSAGTPRVLNYAILYFIER